MTATEISMDWWWLGIAFGACYIAGVVRGILWGRRKVD